MDNDVFSPLKGERRFFLFQERILVSFEALIKEISPKLRGIVYKVSGHLRLSDAEDLYGEVVARLWEEYQAGRLLDKTNSYVLQSCYFFLKNYLRKNSGKASFVSMDALLADGVIDFESFSLESEENVRSPAVAEDLDELMERVFYNELTRKEKEIAFFYMQGWTTREIGERLGVSHVNVLKVEEEIRRKCRKSKGSAHEKN